MKSDYCIGSEWVYFKIYCGYKAANVILRDTVPFFIEDIKNQKILKNWFFIRYNDPEPHLRLRIRLKNIGFFGDLIKIFNNHFDPLITNFTISKIQLDTYSREIERYRDINYDYTESFFEYDSEAILNYLVIEPRLDDEKYKLYYSFFAIDSFLDICGFNLSKKHEVLRNLQKSFKTEFSISSFTKKELLNSFREFEVNIENVIKKMTFTNLTDIVDFRNSRIKNTNVDLCLSSLYISSFIHMSINRQFTSRQREYELIIYDHLFRFYEKKMYCNGL